MVTRKERYSLHADFRNNVKCLNSKTHLENSICTATYGHKVLCFVKVAWIAHNEPMAMLRICRDMPRIGCSLLNMCETVDKCRKMYMLWYVNKRDIGVDSQRRYRWYTQTCASSIMHLRSMCCDNTVQAQRIRFFTLCCIETRQPCF